MKEVQNSYNTSQNQTNNPRVCSRVQLYGGGCVTLITILVSVPQVQKLNIMEVVLLITSYIIPQ